MAKKITAGDVKADTITADDVTANDISADDIQADYLARDGNAVITDNDTIGLHNTWYPGWLHASTFVKDNRREPYVRDPDERVRESYWQVSHD